MIEFAIYGIVLLMLTAGFVDVGRAFFQYNAVSSAARYGARWGSVVGGTCLHPYQASTSDWCNQLAASTSPFWVQPGNRPKQDAGAACPTSYSAANVATYFYQVSNYTATTSTTIMGAIAHRFDSNNSSTSFIHGVATPGFDLAKLYVCIELPASTWVAATTAYQPSSGSTVKVYLYYPFVPAAHLITNLPYIPLVASSEYVIE